jgi:hypothetical protein
MAWIAWYGTSGGVSSCARATGSATESIVSARAIAKNILILVLSPPFGWMSEFQV